MNTSTETCPSLEDLAAFLDGRLSGDERNRIVAHLADCPSCYEVFAEAARYRLDEEEDEEEPAPPGEIEVPKELVAAYSSGEVVPFPRKPIFRLVSSIAAVLIVGLMAVPLYRAYYALPEITSAQLVTSTIVSQAKQDVFWDQFNIRGEEEGGGIDSDSPEFLIGARIVHLAGHLSRNDRVTALNDLASINGHAKQLGLLIPREQVEAFKRMQAQIDNGQRPADLARDLTRIEKALTQDAFSADVTPYFAFGKWTEAGRLSSLAKSPDFFEASENRQFLRALLYHGLREYNLDSEVATTLEDIKETLETTAPSSLPYQDLHRQFEQILTFYQNKSEEELAPAGLSPVP